MRHKPAVSVILAVVLALTASAGASTNTKPNSRSVHVQQPLSVAHNVVISFRPRVGLPRGGYYYAVLVLVDYVLYQPPTPRCAVSSDMQKTQYAYPTRARPVRLVLTAAKSAAGQWCPQGNYSGAIYSVSHAPRYGTTAQCFGNHVCGVVANPTPPPYNYPGGLPKPLDKSARVVRRFRIHFPAS